MFFKQKTKSLSFTRKNLKHMIASNKNFLCAICVQWYILAHCKPIETVPSIHFKLNAFRVHIMSMTYGIRELFINGTSDCDISFCQLMKLRLSQKYFRSITLPHTHTKVKYCNQVNIQSVTKSTVHVFWSVHPRPCQNLGSISWNS